MHFRSSHPRRLPPPLAPSLPTPTPPTPALSHFGFLSLPHFSSLDTFSRTDCLTDPQTMTFNLSQLPFLPPFASQYCPSLNSTLYPSLDIFPTADCLTDPQNMHPDLSQLFLGSFWSPRIPSRCPSSVSLLSFLPRPILPRWLTY